MSNRPTRRTAARSVLSAVAFAMVVAAATGCTDALMNAPAAPAGPEASISMTLSFSASSGGTRQAYDKVDTMFVRFTSNGEVRLQKTVAFLPNGTPTSPVTVVRVSVPLRAATEKVEADVDLRRGANPLFHANASVTLSTGAPTPLKLILTPVIAGVACGSGPLQLDTYGSAGTVAGAALFVTGDTITGAPVTYSSTSATPASPAISVAADGQLIALQDGISSLTCIAGGISAGRAIQVLAVPRIIVLDPPGAVVLPGAPVPFSAKIFDGNGNVITSAQPLVWSSSNPSVASVSTTGLVSALTPGTARISATIGQTTGSAQVASLASPQGASAVTVGASGVTGTSATLIGSVNAGGPNNAVPTEAYFTWGPNTGSGNQFVTPRRLVPQGSTNVLITDVITGLTPGITYDYQVVTVSGTTTTTGSVQSFQTPALPTAATLGKDSTFTRGVALQGSATPNGSPTLAWFEYGTSATLATFTQTVKQPIGAGSGPVTVRQALPTLPASTTYYARLVASNSGGTVSGSIVPFTTPAVTAAAP